MDIGCGAGGSFPQLGNDRELVCGIDVSSIAVAIGQFLGRNTICASATSLPFADKQFDLVVSADVMEHLHEDDVPAAAQEAIRVARLYIFMRIATNEDVGQPWKKIAGHPLHLTIRPFQWWMQFFRDAGDFVRQEEHVFCLRLHAAMGD